MAVMETDTWGFTYFFRKEQPAGGSDQLGGLFVIF